MKILIAEDDLTSQRVLEAMLLKWGHEPVVTGNGQDAWERLQSGNAPRLALLDWMMPGMSGLDVCRQVRQRTAPGYTYVIILTARSDSQDAITALEAGADDFVSKPFHPHELRARINTAQRILELEESLSKRAFYDQMTGLPNRSLLAEHFRGSADAAIRNGEMLAFLYCDVDHFKMVNDNFGHAAGDAFLKDVSGRLRENLADAGTLARVGGDEFVLLANVESADDATTLAKRIRDVLARPIEAHGHRLSLAASIGISLFPNNGDSLDVLLRNADQAMFETKRRHSGECFQFFDEEVGARYRARLMLETRLPDALRRNEFVLHYQPVFRLSDWGQAGAEALIRWNEPTRGLVSPAEFIPIAEETGHIIAIGKWVLNQACKHLKHYAAKADADFRVAVNISASQFADGGLVDMVAEALSQHGVNPGSLELELTETALVRNLENSAATIRALRDLGVRVALDDFGTGYSSFSYLANLPINTLKVDKSFLPEVNSNHGRFAVLKAIVDLAHKLGIMVVAEGIEDAEQLKATEDAGCDEVQGFLLGKPASPEWQKPVPPAEMTRGLNSLARHLAARSPIEMPNEAIDAVVPDRG
jgi:diguanylate cyclase (GGDEF)-like protein